jgi:hypothetical protein
MEAFLPVILFAVEDALLADAYLVIIMVVNTLKPVIIFVQQSIIAVIKFVHQIHV